MIYYLIIKIIIRKKYDILYGTRDFPYNILNNENLQVIINYKKDYKKIIKKI